MSGSRFMRLANKLAPKQARVTAKTGAAAAGGGATTTTATGARPNMPKWKAAVVSGGFAVVVITGTIYGAGLKERQQVKAKIQETQKIRETTFAEKMAVLETRRAQLSKQKLDLEIKLADLHARMAGMAPSKTLPDGKERPRARELFGEKN